MANENKEKNMATYTIDTYTGQYDDATTPRVEPVAGETYRLPSRHAADGREAYAFALRVREARLCGEYSDSDDEWDYYELVPVD